MSRASLFGSQGGNGSSTRHHDRVEDARAPSPEGGARATIAETASHASANARGRTACHGDIYVVDVSSGDHFHIIAALKAPLHPLTSVTHRALHRTVFNLLLDSKTTHTGDSTTQPRPLPLLLLDGVPLDDSDAVALPNGAVVEVYRGSADSLPRSAELPLEKGLPLQSTSAVSATREHMSALEAMNSDAAGERKSRTRQSTMISMVGPSPSPSRRQPAARAGGVSCNNSLLSDSDSVAGTRDRAMPYAFMRTSGTATPTESRPRGAITLSPSPSFHASAHQDCIVSRKLTLSLPAPSRHDSASVSTRPSEREAIPSATRVSSLHTVDGTHARLHRRTNASSSISARPRTHESDAAVRGQTISSADSRSSSSASSASTMHSSYAFTSPAFSQDSSVTTEEPSTHRRDALPSASRASSAAADRLSSTPLCPGRAAPSAEPLPTSSASALTPVALQNAAAFDSGSQAVPTSVLSAPPTEHSPLQTSASLPSPPPLQLTAQEIYDTQRSSIAAAAAAEQRRLLTRLQQRCQVLEEEKKALLTARLGALRAQETASRLRALRETQEETAAVEVDTVRALLGKHREDLLGHWLRVVQLHKDTHYAMSSALLRDLEDEGNALTLDCLSSIAGYHTQKARLQALQQQHLLKEEEVARLRWETQVRQCTLEEQRGCLRVVARLRPPSERSWLPASVRASAEAVELDGDYAVRVLEGSPDAARVTQPISKSVPCMVEVVDRPRDLRRRYALWAAYNAVNAGSQQRLFEDQLQPLLEHMCRTGQSVAVLAFGAVGSGKTFALFGSRTAQLSLQPMTTANMDVLSPQPRQVDGESASAEVFNDGDFSSSSNSSGSRCECDNARCLPNGITAVGTPVRQGITRCLDPADAAREAEVLESLAETKAAKRRQRRAERKAQEERGWRERAGIQEGDGLLPRAVAWLTAHLPSESPHDKTSGPVVDSVVFSMYEVYNDHVYDLLPTPPPSATGTRKAGSKASPPRWNAGWLPAPHIKNSNPENLTELQLERMPASADERGAARDMFTTISHLQQQQQQQQRGQPQWSVKAVEMEVRSAKEALQAIQLGLHRRRSAATLRGVQSSRSHLFLRFRVKMQCPVMPAKSSSIAMQWASTTAAASAAGIGAPPISSSAASAATMGAAGRPKGYDFLRAALGTPPEGATSAKQAAPASSVTCVAELLFTDFAGSERIDLSGVKGDMLKETQYIHSSLGAVSEVLMAVARTHPRRDPQGETAAVVGQPGKQLGGDGTLPLTAAALVLRWGAMLSCPGVTLSRSPPVFLQPRFTKLGGDRDIRQRGEHEGALALRRHALALMDKDVAEGEGTQPWRRWRDAPPHVPFRTCKTTQLLQSALGASCKTLVLACVQPCSVSEVVLPAGLQNRKGPRTRAAAQSVFAHQAPLMLSEVHATLTFAERIHDASQDGGKAKRA